MDKKDRAARWQARMQEVGIAQSRYLAILLALAIFFHGVLVSDGNSPDQQTILSLKLPSPLLYALGPFALCFSTLAAYGTMRRASQIKLRFKVLDAYVPSSFMETPNFLDAHRLRVPQDEGEASGFTMHNLWPGTCAALAETASGESALVTVTGANESSHATAWLFWGTATEVNTMDSD